jgi:hypothetical protein
MILLDGSLNLFFAAHTCWWMHPVLLISSILDSIFNVADKQSNVICAQVCKLWAKNTLDAVWHDLKTPQDPLKILGHGMKVELGAVVSLLRYLKLHYPPDKRTKG